MRGHRRKEGSRKAGGHRQRGECKDVGQNGHGRGAAGGQFPQAAADGVPAHLPPLPLLGRQNSLAGRLADLQGLPLPGKGVGEGDRSGTLAGAASSRSTRRTVTCTISPRRIRRRTSRMAVSIGAMTHTAAVMTGKISSIMTDLPSTQRTAKCVNQTNYSIRFGRGRIDPRSVKSA